MEESFGRAPTNLEANLKTRLPNASKSLEIGDVELKFHFKMFEFMD
jgi:hypothetical protein